MALPELRGTGRLLTAPRTGTTSTGTPYASTLVKFPQWRKADGEWEEGEGAVASVIAYDDNAALLAAYAKGDDVGVHGSCKPAIYKDKPQLAVTATQIWTPEKTPRAKVDKPTTPNTRTTSTLAAARASASASLRQVTGRAAVTAGRAA